MRLLIYLFFLFALTSCIVQAPKYAEVEEVLALKPGMTIEEVTAVLGVPPYDVKMVSDEGVTHIYKYRTTDRRTVPFFMNKTNGVKAKGKWVDLFVTYGETGRVIQIESCSDCEKTKVKEKKIDMNSIIMLVTVTVPSVLIYLGLSL